MSADGRDDQFADVDESAGGDRGNHNERQLSRRDANLQSRPKAVQADTLENLCFERAYEWQVFGDESEALFGSTRSSTTVSEGRLPSILRAGTVRTPDRWCTRAIPRTNRACTIGRQC